MGFIRWLTNHRCFKVQYGAVMVTIIVISLFGRGYKLSGSNLHWSKDLTSSLELQEYSRVIVVNDSSYVTNTDNDSNLKRHGENRVNNLPINEFRKKVDKFKFNISKSVINSKLKDVINFTKAPNIPEEIFNHRNTKTLKRLPHFSDIHINNHYWQSFEIMKGVIMNLFSAFYDNRVVFQGKAYVRILSIMNKMNIIPKLFCKMWFHKGKATSSKAKIHLVRYFNKSTLFTHMIQCEVPLNYIDKIPFAVSLVTNRDGRATNLLQVINNEPIDGRKKDFAVCHKGLDFPFYDISIKLVEWLELLYIVGVSKVIFYEFNVHPNISRVLQYYTLKDRVEVMPLTLSGDQPTKPKELHEYLQTHYQDQLSQEKLPYNDCFYRHMKSYKYIVNLDFDEIIIPHKSNSLQDLIGKINTNLTDNGKKLPDEYEFQRVQALDKFRGSQGYDPGIPKYMHMLQNVYLLNKYTGGPKSIISTERAITSKTHKVDRCQSRCLRFNVPTETAHILHFRNSCKGSSQSYCTEKNSFKDKRIWKYKEELIKKTTEVLRELELI